MLTQWESNLRASGARLSDGVVSDFGDSTQERQAAAAQDVIADLSEYALIQASGDEREAFLQAQFSNDIRLLKDVTQLHAYCTAQGRMLAIFRAFARGDTIMLQLPRAIADATLKRLRMFVLRAKVTLERVDDRFARLGISGPGAAERLKALKLATPEVNGAYTENDIAVLALPGRYPRFELVAEPERLAPLWQALAQHCRPVGAPVWRWLDIQAGVPNVFPPTLETFVPQMANLDRIGGISFTKGCYPGQEIVARMHYLGRLKQRMYAAHLADIPAGSAPAPGDPLYAPDFGAQATGHVVDAQLAPDGGYDLLAVMQISSHDAGEIHWHTVDGPRLQLRELPYALADASRA